jgi:hypothetical protein
MNIRILGAAALAAPLALAYPAAAAPAQFGDPLPLGDGLTLDPILEARLRWENVDTPAAGGDAVTLRMRSGFEVKHAPSHLAFLAEAEATLGIINDYNAFPFAVASHQRRPGNAVIADPETIELNRVQLQYKTKHVAVTVGRQRINLDDQRFVGAVGWRQNEQTFDAVRGEATFGPVSLDATYSISTRSIFGSDAGPRQGMGGEFVFLGAGAKLGPVNLKAFSYLLAFDESFFFANSSQTYGGRATASFPLSKKLKLNFAASYARQSDYGTNPVRYTASYVAGEAGLIFKSLTVTGGYELLGGDGAAKKSFQTPLATLHKFNGWADLFLTTPQKAGFGGLQDVFGGVAYKFDGVKALPGLNAAVF